MNKALIGPRLCGTNQLGPEWHFTLAWGAQVRRLDLLSHQRGLRCPALHFFIIDTIPLNIHYRNPAKVPAGYLLPVLGVKGYMPII